LNTGLTWRSNAVALAETGMKAVNPNLINALQEQLGPKGITTDAADMAPWLRDWRGLYSGSAAALVSPASTDEVAAVVRMALAAGVPIVPQGGNTSMVGGATPLPDGRAIILSLRRMNAIRALDAGAATVVAEAGVILAHLHDAAGDMGMRFPLTLGGKGSATVGGLISTNAGGTQVLRFGTMRKLVLGLEAVLPDGSVHHGLAALKKDNRGYDFNHLLIGAEGTLGVVTAATLRLVPAIVDRAVGWVGVESPNAALALLRWMEARSGDAVEGFEVMPQATLELVLAHVPGTRAPLESRHAWHVLIEFVEASGAQARLESLLAGAMEAGLIETAAVSTSEAQADAFWKIRDSISEAERASGPAIQHDISVAVEAMPDFMTHAVATIEREFPQVTSAAFGHLGDGNVHLHVRAPKDVADVSAWRKGPGKAASRRVYDLVVAAGGSISAEHGIGQMKLDELVRLSDPARLAMMRAIKTAFDPAGIMNPGKLVPLAPDTPDA
jgi:FAD/FMN-containing dehydrogenase